MLARDMPLRTLTALMNGHVGVNDVLEVTMDSTQWPTITMTIKVCYVWLPARKQWMDMKEWGLLKDAPRKPTK